MDQPRALEVRRLVSFRRSSMRRQQAPATIAAGVIRFACAALIVWVGVIHVHLWATGYRQIPTDGPMFLLDGIVAFALAAALIVLPRPVIGLLSAGFLLSTLGALVISINIGLFGFKESLSASFVVLSIVIEAVAALGALIWTALVVARS